MNESPCFEQFSNSTYFDICPSFFLILLGCELGTVVSFLHPKINDGVLLIVSDSKIFFIFSKSLSKKTLLEMIIPGFNNFDKYELSGVLFETSSIKTSIGS